MSGTSMDGIDAVLVSFDSERRIAIRRSSFTPYPASVRQLLADLIENPRRDRESVREIDIRLGELYADAVLQLLADSPDSRVRAIGCHGQTILHDPFASPPFSWQAGDAETLARLTGIPVVDDFRSADMRYGGQGAPLAPAFHQYAFNALNEAIAVVNIGGIANVTYLPAEVSGEVIGFDTGPGNSLCDRWIQKCHGLSYDKDGEWAESAPPDQSLLDLLMTDQYFLEAPPKSLDTRYFSIRWLEEKLDAMNAGLDAAAVQSTLAAFTAESIWLAIEKWTAGVQRIVLCGGGAHNRAIVSRLTQASGLSVSTSQEFGVPPDDVEACAFAWLAERRVNGIAANLPSVTGASEQVILGSVTEPH